MFSHNAVDVVPPITSLIVKLYSPKHGRLTHGPHPLVGVGVGVGVFVLVTVTVGVTVLVGVTVGVLVGVTVLVGVGVGVTAPTQTAQLANDVAPTTVASGIPDSAKPTIS
jgi:hypothetical protein